MADDKPNQLDPEWDVYGMQPWIVYLAEANIPMLNAISQRMAPSNGCARMMLCEVVQFAILSLYSQIFAIMDDNAFLEAPTAEEITADPPEGDIVSQAIQLQDKGQAILFKLFDFYWSKAALRGECDSMGGAEYERVKKLFQPTNLLFSIRSFIAQHANVPPLTTPEKPSSSAGADPDDNVRIERHKPERG